MEILPGHFCWIELASSDAGGAKHFYGQLFGWSYSDVPIGDERSYTLFHLQGRTTAAMYQQGAERDDIPPHWASYVLVDNVDETCRLALSVGGAVIREPFDVMDIGRMAVLTDVNGATFCIWQSYKHGGVETLNEPGGLTYNELLTPDVAACEQFYAQLFGWSTQEQQALSRRYVLCSSEGRVAAGIRELPESLSVPVSGYWLVYLRVTAIESLVSRAIALGGECPVEVADAPGGGRFAVLQDPDGALFAVCER